MQTEEEEGEKGNTGVLKNVVFTCFPVAFLSNIQMQLRILVSFKNSTRERKALNIQHFFWAPCARFHLPNMNTLEFSGGKSQCPVACV